DRAAHEVVERRRAAAIRHVNQLGAGLFHEQLDREIVERRGAGRAEGELARARLGVIDELLDRVHRRLGVEDHGGGVFGRAGDGKKIAQRVERRGSFPCGGGGGNVPRPRPPPFSPPPPPFPPPPPTPP